MSAEKRWWLICYDIRDPKRYRGAHKLLKGAGRPVQYSVFRCRLDDIELERLRWELAKVLDATDRLLVLDLCPRCAERVISRNHVEGWTREPETFRVLTTPHQAQAPIDEEEPAPSDPGRAAPASKKRDL